MKKIIVPVDFSKESLKGLDLAIMIANKMEAGVEILHVMNPSDGVFKDSSKGPGVVEEEDMKKIIRQYEQQMTGGGRITWAIREGKVPQEVKSHAHDEDAEMIVGSTHGASGFEEMFTGSNALKIMALSSIPVILTRPEDTPEKLDKILLPIDETLESRQKAPFSAKLARAFNAKIILLTLLPDTENPEHKARVSGYKKQVEDYLKEHNVKFQEVEKEGNNLVKSILDCQKEYGGDLISVMAEEERTLSPVLLGSNVQRLLVESSQPVMCISQMKIHKGPFFPFDPK